MSIVTVDLKTKQYAVKIGATLHNHIGSEVASVWTPRKVALLTDSNVGPLYLSATSAQLTAAGFEVLPLQVPAGEQAKSLPTVSTLVEQMAQAGFTRGDGLIALGGGVIGDLGGVVASLYMRGIGFIQIATSLTAQVDSSVGGKTAVNLESTKNIIGTFYQPDLVLVDSTYLDTLADRDLVEGYAEVVKTSALADAAFFALTGTIQSVDDIRANAIELSTRSIEYKAKVVMDDEKEAGQRQFLNFGHTIGHAIELLAHGGLRHGEAIAIGMITISQRFERDGLTAKGLTQALSERLTVVGLPINSDIIGSPEFYAKLINDKKNHGGQLNLVALSDIAQPTIIKKAISDMPEFIG
ncbi:MAG: 3-dehydroquinate synthase [Lactobacillaceae bacterium]|jgi:3-dehydroquinate synthase|nr:3-dehydroquinate synthase [Lactobacillaceae bacterium]